ncbi:NAD(P)/FAD-dependent oxidoreductase [Micromonospora sp. NPDC049679]|uniref:flavin-containing monooxygenase n=1 Tax=Micromonospora sp. NPDC049679 TaxID=3155920 RepID=UPI00340F8B94
MPLIDILVIGGGQAGLVAAHAARQHGLHALILEGGPTATGSWSRYYDSLRLFSPARYSSLPGFAFPGDPDRYPTRDEVVGYLADYAARLDTPIETATRVTAVARTDEGFAVTAADGRGFEARTVVSATGGFGRPYRPDLPGLDTFAGTVLHSADYRRPQPFVGQRVIVVGAGNSAVQIAAELAEVARVTLTSRSPVRFAPQRPLGIDLHAWLHRTGAELLPLRGRRGGRATPVLDTGRYRAALADGRPDWRPMFTTVGPEGVVWADGTTDAVDAILLATGFRPEVSHLAGCYGPDGRPAVDDRGHPVHTGGVSTTVPGLGFVGLELQRGLASATLRGVSRDARRVIPRVNAGVPARSVITTR